MSLKGGEKCSVNVVWTDVGVYQEMIERRGLGLWECRQHRENTCDWPLHV